MQPDALKKLRCPACLGGLQLVDFAVPGASAGPEVETGLVLCERCAVAYPLQAAVPVMLRFGTPFHEWFAREAWVCEADPPQRRALS